MAVEQSGSRALESAAMHEAAVWLEQLHSGVLTDVAFEQWLRWLALSDTHLVNYWRMEELWQLFGKLAAAPWPTEAELRADPYIAAPAAEDWFRKHSPP